MIKDKYKPEVWTTLVHYDRKTWKRLDIQDKYSISSYGRVKNNYTDEFVAPQLTGNPAYWYVNLTPLSGKRKLVRIHLVMCYSFFGLSEDLVYTCDHEDQNSYNNSLWNLRWASHKQQTNNRTITVMVGEIPLTELTSLDNFNLKETDYIRNRLSLGNTYEEAINCLHKYHKRGGSYTRTININGLEVDLWDWCEGLNLDYRVCCLLLSKGWSLFQIQYNIPPVNLDLVFEFEGICFPRRDLLLSYLNISECKYLDLRREGFSLDDIKQNRQEYLDRFKFQFQGFFMTKQEHCDRLGTSIGRVDTSIHRYGMSLEDALLIKPQRVIKHTINSVTKRNSEWSRYYNIPAKTLNSYLCRHKCLKKTLQHFGVDTSDLEILPYF